MINKLKSKKGGTTLVELIICFPLIVIILFLPIGFYQKAEQLTYIEDIKTSLLQEVSRKGQLTTEDINDKWIPKFEKMNGITVKSITPLEEPVYRSSDEVIDITLVINTKPSIFSTILSSDYTTKAVVYSEFIGD